MVNLTNNVYINGTTSIFNTDILDKFILNIININSYNITIYLSNIYYDYNRQFKECLYFDIFPTNNNFTSINIRNINKLERGIYFGNHINKSIIIDKNKLFCLNYLNNYSPHPSEHYLGSILFLIIIIFCGCCIELRFDDSYNRLY